MIQVTRYATNGGNLHITQHDAQCHLDRQEASIMSHISHLIVGLKFAEAQIVIDSLAPHFKELAFIRNDMELEEQDND